MATPEQVASDISASVARLLSAVAGDMQDAAGNVRDTTRGATHEVTGDLKASITAQEPYQAGRIVAAVIEPVGIPYAEDEASKGAEHSFAVQGFAQSSGHIETLRRNLEQTLLRAAEGRL